MQLSKFRRYAVLTGKFRRFGVTACLLVVLAKFRRYAVLTGTVIDVSALRSVYWYSYRRLGVTQCLLIVIDVSALRRAYW